MSFLDGIGEVLKKATNHIQNREERRRNEIDKLEEERRSIIQNDPCTVKSANRIIIIDARLSELYKAGKND